MHTIYLDHNATTPMLPEVAAAMAECQATAYGNPSSAHSVGRRAKQALEDAREGIAELLGAKLTGRDADRLIFTSGGTESNNIALASLSASANGSRTLVISPIEHPSVGEMAKGIGASGPCRVEMLGVSREGVVSLARLEELLAEAEQGALPPICGVSAMLANNETGVLQPVREIAALCGQRKIATHTDAVQAAGKLSLDFRALGVSLMTVAAHKFHGPRGIGAPLARHDAPLAPLLLGGPQQEKKRPGTEPVALAVGMFAALQGWQADRAQQAEHLAQMRDAFERAILQSVPNAVIHSAGAARLPNTSLIAFPGCERQALLLALDLEGVCCSAGAACQSGASEPSAALLAMGIARELVESSLRFSFGLTNTPEEAAEAALRVAAVCRRIVR